MENDTMEITQEEFMRIQTEIVQLKTEVYETKLREENLQKKLDKALESASASQEKEKSTSFFPTSLFGGGEAEKAKETPPPEQPADPPPPQSPSKAEKAEKEAVRLRGIVARQNNQTIKLNAEVRILRAKVLAKKEKAEKGDEGEGGEKEEEEEKEEKVDDLESLGIEVSDALVAELNEEKKKCAKYKRQIEELKKKGSEAKAAPAPSEPAPEPGPEPTLEPSVNEELKQHLESLQRQLSQAKEELQVLQEDRNAILTSVAEKDLLMSTLRDQITEMESSFKEEKKKTENLRKTVRELRSSVQTKEDEGSLHEIEEQMKKNSQLQDKLTETEKELQKTVEERDQVTEERDNIKARYQQDIQLLSEQSEQQQTKDKETQDILKEKTDEHERQIVELKASHFRALEENQEQYVEQLESNKQCYKGEIEHLKGEFAAKEEELRKEFEAKEEGLTKQLEAKEEQNKKQVKDLAFLEQQQSAVKNLIREADAERLKSQNEMKESQEKLGNIEKVLSEKLELAEEEKQKLANEVKTLKESHSNEIGELDTAKVEEISRLEEELVTLRGDCEKKQKELNAEIEELKKEIKNHRKQIVVNEKKSKNLIKELQSQIQKEKSIRETTNLSRKKQVVVPEIPVRRNPEAELVKKIVKKEPSEGGVGSNSEKKPTASAPIMPPKRMQDKGRLQLQNEVLHLSKVLGDVQGKLFQLEESNRFLKENIGVLKTEIDKKEKIIQEYLVKMKTSRAAVETQKPAFSSTYLLDHVVGHFTGEVTLNQEVYSKTLSALEETMLQNIQLRKDMEHIGNEVERFGEENRVLKLKLRDYSQDEGKSEGKMKEKEVNS